jgi:hypothetical protein
MGNIDNNYQYTGLKHIPAVISRGIFRRAKAFAKSRRKNILTPRFAAGYHFRKEQAKGGEPVPLQIRTISEFGEGCLLKANNLVYFRLPFSKTCRFCRFWRRDRGMRMVESRFL